MPKGDEANGGGPEARPECWPPDTPARRRPMPLSAPPRQPRGTSAVRGPSSEFLRQPSMWLAVRAGTRPFQPAARRSPLAEAMAAPTAAERLRAIEARLREHAQERRRRQRRLRSATSISESTWRVAQLIHWLGPRGRPPLWNSWTASDRARLASANAGGGDSSWPRKLSPRASATEGQAIPRAQRSASSMPQRKSFWPSGPCTSGSWA
jgi:hypothetical protein